MCHNGLRCAPLGNDVRAHCPERLVPKPDLAILTSGSLRKAQFRVRGCTNSEQGIALNVAPHMTRQMARSWRSECPKRRDVASLSGRRAELGIFDRTLHRREHLRDGRSRCASQRREASRRDLPRPTRRDARGAGPRPLARRAALSSWFHCIAFTEALCA